MGRLIETHSHLKTALPGFSTRLHRFCLLTAAATLALLGVGGLVTSHGVGMSVPDWPNTYGYNMFAFPISQWVGGVFYEHSHRLLASAVGLLTTFLALWFWMRETRGRNRWLGVTIITAVILLMGFRQMPVYLLLAGSALVVIVLALVRIARSPGALRWWGILAFAAVILQGVLGGLRVVWIKDEIGIFHAALAQLFFVLMCALAVVTSRKWSETRALRSARPVETNPTRSSLLRRLAATATVLVFVQLIIGATMRHQHAGLAIPDFPLAYGKIWPATDAASVALYNQQRLEITAVNPITSFQIVLQMAHRLMAVLILLLVSGAAWLTWKQRRQVDSAARNWAGLWLGLILVQVLLGAVTIWTGKAADIATLHVLVGALSLATGAMLSLQLSQQMFLGIERAGVVAARLEEDDPVPSWPARPASATE